MKSVYEFWIYVALIISFEKYHRSAWTLNATRRRIFSGQHSHCPQSTGNHYRKHSLLDKWRFDWEFYRFASLHSFIDRLSVQMIRRAEEKCNRLTNVSFRTTKAFATAGDGKCINKHCVQLRPLSHSPHSWFASLLHSWLTFCGCCGRACDEFMYFNAVSCFGFHVPIYICFFINLSVTSQLRCIAMQ